MEQKQIGQEDYRGLSGTEVLFEDMKTSLKCFQRKKYPDCFAGLMRRHQGWFEMLEAECKGEADAQKRLRNTAEEAVDLIKQRISELKWNFQKENLQADCSIYLVAYLIPLIRARESDVCEIFAQELLEAWNREFGTSLQAGTYEQILNGFRTGIFGINFSGK